MLRVKVQCGKKRFEVEVLRQGSVGDLRLAVIPHLEGEEYAACRDGGGRQQCRIICAGKTLTGNSARLSDYSINDGAAFLVRGVEEVAEGDTAQSHATPAPAVPTPQPDAAIAGDEDDEDAALQLALRLSAEEATSPAVAPEPIDEEMDEDLRAALKLSEEEDAKAKEEEKKKGGAAPDTPAEEDLKEIDFERFDSDNVVAGDDTLERLREYYSETNRYVDAQFPPLPKSIYLDPRDAERWACSNCGRANPLPPMQPPPTTQREAEEQNRKLESIRCACGGRPTHVQQVNIVNRPTVWLRPGTHCDGCLLILSHTQGVQDAHSLVSRQCTHFIRDDMTQNTVGGSYKVVRDTPRPEDVYQGALGNCWFGGALSCVAMHADLVSNMLVTPDYSPIGAYVVQLHHSGSWRRILIDDTFPCSATWEGRIEPTSGTIYFSRGGHMCYAKAARQSLWVPLVEKAAAKLFASYGALSGGTLAEALQMFTGYACDTVQLRMTEQQYTRKRKRREQIANMRTQLLLQGKDPEEVPFEDDDEDGQDDVDIIWSKLLSASEAGYIMGTACSHEACGSTRDHFVEKLGLQTPHAYSVLQVKEIVHQGRVVRLMQFRNPWGERAPRTWQGDWGSKWAGWTRELQLELGVINSSGVKMNDDMSVFWIALEDARRYFVTIDVCRVHPRDWHRAAATAWLPSELGPGEHFTLKTYRRTVIDLILWQEKHITRESALKAIPSNVDIMFALLRRRADASGSGSARAWHCIEAPQSSFADQISTEVVLEGGFEYTVVPFSTTMMQAGHLSMRLRRVTLACYSDHPVEVAKAVSPGWGQVAECISAAICQRGKEKKLSPTLSSFALTGRAGQLTAVENRSPTEQGVVQVDYETMGCLSTLPDNLFSRITAAPPLTRQICLGVAIRGAGGFHSDVSQHPAEAAQFAQHAGDIHTPGACPDPAASWGYPPPDAALLAEAEAIEQRKAQAAADEEERLLQEALKMSEEVGMQVDSGGAEGGDDEAAALEAALRMSMEEGAGDGGGGGGGPPEAAATSAPEDEEMDEELLRAIELSKNDPENQ